MLGNREGLRELEGNELGRGLIALGSIVVEITVVGWELTLIGEVGVDDGKGVGHGAGI